jgi:hypothetical protein
MASGRSLWGSIAECFGKSNVEKAGS